MRIIYALAFSVCLFTACQQRTKITGEKDKNETVGGVPVTEQVCYSYVKGKDTAELTLITTGIVSTGELKYKWFEKDNNSGAIAGEMRGDTLLADYTFNSEGVRSVRQVVFLKKGDQLLEGFGDVEDRNGKTQFKDLKKVDFSNPITFSKSVCK